MARKKAATSPFQGKVVCLDSKIGSWAINGVSASLRHRGASIQSDLDATVDFLVLDESRRATPGRSQLEKAAIKLKSTTLQTIYLNDLHAMLLPTREEALAVLHAAPKSLDAWKAIQPHRNSTAHIDLKGADLSGLDLTNYPFDRCELDGAKFDGAIIRGADFGALRNVDLHKVGDHENIALTSAEGCNFDGLTFTRYSLYKGCTRCTFRGCTFRDRTLPDTWTDCDLSEVDLTGGSSWSWKTVNLIAEKTNFSEADLKNAVMAGARCAGAVFRDATLRQVDLSGGDLREADLTRANLEGANLQNADLRKASFRNALLTGANLTGAKITGADFTGANLTGAKLDGLNLKSAKGLAQATQNGSVAGPLLTQFCQATVPGKLTLHFTLESPTLGQVPCELSLKAKPTLQRTLNTSTTYQMVADVPTALLGLATVVPDGVPRIDTIQVRPLNVGKQHLPLAIQALCEVFGQPIPEVQDLRSAKKAAQAKTATNHQSLMAELRQSIVAWNQQTYPQRRKQADAFKGADLSGCDLQGALFNSIHGAGINFENSDLRKCSLSSAKLGRANLHKSDLREANIRWALVREANAEEADLRKADLTNSNWKQANLRNAKMQDANLLDASFEGTDLTGANLAGVQVRDTTYDGETKFPTGFTPGTGWKFTGSRPARPVAPVVAPPKQNLIFSTFFDKLPGVVDAGRLSNAVSMLRAAKFQLFIEKTDDHVIGVVRSQSSGERVYACRLTSTGQYECGTQNLRICGGLQGRVCKHLLVLLLGLTRAGTLDSGTALQWLQMAQKQTPTFDAVAKETMTATFLKFVGVQSGEVDWRPTETVPEDYYAL